MPAFIANASFSPFRFSAEASASSDPYGLSSGPLRKSLISSWRGSKVQTMNLALSKSLGAHAAEACVAATPRANRAPKAATWRRIDRRRRCPELFIVAAAVMPATLPFRHDSRHSGGVARRRKWRLCGGCFCGAEPLTAGTLPWGENEFVYVRACRRGRHVRGRIGWPFAAARVARQTHDRRLA